MFNQEKEMKINSKEVETIIGPSVKVTGDFNCQGNIVIDGMVDGSVSTEGDLMAGERSKITANVRAKNAKIAGYIKGNLDINGYLELLSTAKIEGDLKAEMVSIAKGAFFSGNCTMTKDSQSKIK